MSTQAEELRRAKRQIKEQEWKRRVKRAKDLGDEEWLIGQYIEENTPFSRASLLREKGALMRSPEDLGEHEKIERKKAAEWRKIKKNEEAAYDKKMEEFNMRRAQCEEDNKQGAKWEILIAILLIIVWLVAGTWGEHPNYEDSGSESYGKYGREE
jgi:hypothetical protein